LNEKLESARNELSRFEVIPLTKEVAETSSELHAGLAKSGRQIGINDIYIAATALRYGLTLVTRNRAHFGRVTGLKLDLY
jgi:predicted nucleic acid-binding protein